MLRALVLHELDALLKQLARLLNGLADVALELELLRVAFVRQAVAIRGGVVHLRLPRRVRVQRPLQRL
eukprot:6304242-Pyramimonas_sp.AAC.1